MKIRLKGVIVEDFVNYKVPSMFLITSKCDFKCCTEQGLDISVCQNEPIAKYKTKDFKVSFLFDAYKDNDITKAIVVGGMEPMLQFDELYELVSFFRGHGIDDAFVIYTGYYPNEISDEINKLKEFPNIVVKFGRYIPNRPKKFDEVLGVTLASDNQFAEMISNNF